MSGAYTLGALPTPPLLCWPAVCTPGLGFCAGGMRVFEHLYARRLQGLSRSFWASLRKAHEYPQTRVCGRVGRGLQACRLRLTGVFVLAYIERDSCRPWSVRDLPGFGPWRFAGGSEKQTSTPSLVGGRAPCDGGTH
jgi:hypothetical protein